jgi:two-component system, NarL family, nitrate/nitrite response regulator NarL
MNEQVRVILADGQPILREGLRVALERNGRIGVVAEAEDGYAAVLAALTHRPDVLILDTEIRKLECVETINRIRAQAPQVGLLVTVMALDPIEIHYLARAGANGFIVKTAHPQEYVNAVLAIAGGGSYFSGSIASRLFQLQERSAKGLNTFGLSEREIEILRLICQGFANKDIARRCGLSVRTVETHRFNIRRKTNAPRLRDLVQIGRQLGVSDNAASAGGVSGNFGALDDAYPKRLDRALPKLANSA